MKALKTAETKGRGTSKELTQFSDAIFEVEADLQQIMSIVSGIRSIADENGGSAKDGDATYKDIWNLAGLIIERLDSNASALNNLQEKIHKEG